MAENEMNHYEKIRNTIGWAATMGWVGIIISTLIPHGHEPLSCGASWAAGGLIYQGGKHLVCALRAKLAQLR